MDAGGVPGAVLAPDAGPSPCSNVAPATIAIPATIPRPATAINQPGIPRDLDSAGRVAATPGGAGGTGLVDTGPGAVARAAAISAADRSA